MPAPPTQGNASIPAAERSYSQEVALGVAALALFGFWLRLWHIDARSLWVDEGSSYAIARLDAWNFLRILWRREANMSLYYLLLRGWMHFGSSEAWLRAPSAIFGALAIPAIYLLGAKLWDRRSGFMAALLLALNAYHVRYSQEARGYTLAVLLVIVSSLCLLNLLQQPTRRRHWAYVLTSALAVYAHFYSALVLLAQWMWLWRTHARLGPGQRAEAKRAVRDTLLILLPVAVFVAGTGAGPLAWLQRPGLRGLYQLAVFLAGGDGAVLVAYLVVIALAVANAIAPSRNSETKDFSYEFVFFWLLLPVLVVFALSFIRPLFLPRFLIIVLPALCLLAAAGITQVRWKVFGALVGIALLALSVHALSSYERNGLDQPNEDWRSAAVYVLQRSTPRQGAIFYSSQCRMPYEFYARDRATAPRVLFPAHGAELSYQDFMGKPDAALLDSLAQRADGIWLVTCHNTLPDGGYDAPTQAIRAALARDFRLVESGHFPGVEVEFYQQAPALPQR